jgi:hypothetical protein
MKDNIEIAEYESDIIPRISETLILRLESNNYKCEKYRIFDIEHSIEVYKDKSSDTNIILHVFRVE